MNSIKVLNPITDLETTMNNPQTRIIAMKAKHISLAFAIVTALLAGCARSTIEDAKPSEQLADLELAYVGATETKAAIDDTTFPEDGEIGLFLFKDEEATQPYGGSGYANVKYSYNSSKGKWTASPSMKVGSTPGYLCGYFPYSSEASDIKAIPVSSSLNGDDAMYATKKTVTDQTASQTAITMNHALARVSLTVINNGYSGDAELTEISFSGAEISEAGTLNALDGSIIATQSDVTLDVTEAQTITAGGTTYECLLVPSDVISSRQDLYLTLTIDGDPKVAHLSGDNGVIIAQNTKSSITISLSNSGISVKTVSVEDWNVVEVGEYKVKVELSEEDDDIDDDVLTRVKVDENTVEILAYSLSGKRLKCILTGTAEVSREIDELDDTFTFTISDIGSDVTATIEYEDPFTVTVTSNNSKWGSATFDGEPYEGETVTFTATAKDRCQFVEWRDSDGNKLDWENPQEITLDSDLAVEAVFEITKIPGALPGKFIVGPGPDGILGTDDDKKVCFSQGNLQAKYSEADDKYTWSFATHQYDVIRNNSGNTTIFVDEHGHFINNDNAVVDLFGWSTYATTITYGICTDIYSSYYMGNFLDWGTTIDDKETWRTLSQEEWSYLSRYNTYRLRVKVMGIDNCCVLYPQGYDSAKIVNFEDKETYSTEEAYNKATEEGVVFLPPTGYRYRLSVSDQYSGGYYWSSTPEDEASSYYSHFKDDYFNSSQLVNGWPRYYGMAVRLVTDYHEL